MGLRPRSSVGLFAMSVPFIIHGAVTGWRRWTLPRWRLRVETLNAVQGARWDRFFESWGDPCVVFLPMVFVAMLAVALAMIRARLDHQPWPRWTSHLWLLPLWLVTASATFASAGCFITTTGSCSPRRSPCPLRSWLPLGAHPSA